MDTHPVAEDDLSPSEIVRRGYDALSLRYRADDAPIGQYGPWLEEIRRRVPPGGRVLDVGCGCGVPVARELTAHAYQVTGIDLALSKFNALGPSCHGRRSSKAT
jgi:2-polyprenyl-3-methyl-5-hydroxy-6-metoxy-1,4-benzoquinol methylase